jgi:hypothetical protein
MRPTYASNTPTNYKHINKLMEEITEKSHLKALCLNRVMKDSIARYPLHGNC